jgi:hypothetical protein
MLPSSPLNGSRSSRFALRRRDLSKPYWRHFNWENFRDSFAELFLAKYIERMGTGTGDMITLCRNTGLREPEFSLTGGFVVLVKRR